MNGGGAAWRASLFLGLTLVLGACGHNHLADNGDTGNAAEGINIYPATYKSDIASAMHAYLNDPTGIRDAAIAQPALKPIGNNTRYVVCLKFNAKKSGRDYAGVKEVVAVFLAGHFDHFVETAHDQCVDATYAPFPELQKLPP